MSKLLDHLEPILVTAVIIFFTWGVGHLIILDMKRNTEFKQQCIESGMQYISGNCVE